MWAFCIDFVYIGDWQGTVRDVIHFFSHKDHIPFFPWIFKSIIPFMVACAAVFGVYRLTREWVRRDEAENCNKVTVALTARFDEIRTEFTTTHASLRRSHKRALEADTNLTEDKIEKIKSEHDIELENLRLDTWDQIAQFHREMEGSRILLYSDYETHTIDWMTVALHDLTNGLILVRGANSCDEMELSLVSFRIKMAIVTANTISVINQSPGVFQHNWHPNKCFKSNRVSSTQLPDLE